MASVCVVVLLCIFCLVFLMLSVKNPFTSYSDVAVFDALLCRSIWSVSYGL